jgi:hypothetical protein
MSGGTYPYSLVLSFALLYIERQPTVLQSVRAMQLHGSASTNLFGLRQYDPLLLHIPNSKHVYPYIDH